MIEENGFRVEKDMDIKSLKDSELLMADAILHAYFDIGVPGWSKEDFINLHILILQEMKNRRIKYEPKDDALDRETLDFLQISLSEKTITVGEVLSSLPDEVVLEPDYCYLVGGIVNRGFSEPNHDFDILVKSDTPNLKLIDGLLEKLPEDLRERVHFVWTSDGPRIGESFPVYDLILRKRKLEKELQIEPITKIEVGKPYTPPKAGTGYRKFEFFDFESFWTEWAQGYIEEGVAIEEKYDGMRMVIHKKGDKVWIFTEDAKRDRAFCYPHVVEQILKLSKEDFILDCEMVEWEEGFTKPKMREDMVKWVTSKEPLDDRWVIFNAFDCPYYGQDLHELPWEERQKYLKKLLPEDTENIHRVRPIIVHNKKEAFEAYKKLSTEIGSEGIMAKWIKSKYDRSRLNSWAKLKNVFEIDAQIVKVIPKRAKETGKVIKGQYIYECAVKDEKGNLVPIGRTYSTAIEGKVGDIITIQTVRVEIHIDKKTGKVLRATWMFPHVKHLRPEKSEPDSIEWLKRIAAKIEYLTEDRFILSTDLNFEFLENCKYWDSEICPFRRKIIPFPHLTLVKEKLEFPIKCPLARLYRCVYVKDYYYSRAKWRGEEDLQGLKYGYPEKENPRFVMQHHWRGRSVHVDFRLEMNDHLVGWTLLDNPIVPEKVATLEKAKEMLEKLDWKLNNEPGMKGQKIRCEEKALQPKAWLKIEGVVEPGQVGATAGEYGVFNIIDKGTWEPGIQKPYFHEYFLHGDRFNGRWVIRQLKVPILDEKKKPTGKYELAWLCWKPDDQTPYLATKRGWNTIPPDGVIPLPKDWIKEHPHEFQKLLQHWKEEGWKEQRETLGLSAKRFALHAITWKGQTVIRDMPVFKYYLRLYLYDKPVEFLLSDNPKYYDNLTATWMGEIEEKWIDFEGTLRPNSKYNPNKRLEATDEIIDKGEVQVRKIEEEPEVFELNFSGEILSGKWKLIQEEDSDIYILMRTEARLRGAEFVLQEHVWELRKPGSIQEKRVANSKFGRYLYKIDSSQFWVLSDENLDVGDRIEKGWSVHWDLRFDLGKSYLDKFTLFEPIEAKSIPAIFSECPDKSWMKKEGSIPPKTPGNPTEGKSEIRILDSGKVDVLERNPNFISLMFHGNKLTGYWIFKRVDEEWWTFEKSKLPMELQEGHPLDKPFDPPVIEEDDEEIRIIFYDLRHFSIVLPEKDSKKYLEDFKVPKGVNINLGSYPREKTVPLIIVQSVEFSKEEGWNLDKALAWIEKNEDFLLSLRKSQIRGREFFEEEVQRLRDRNFEIFFEERMGLTLKNEGEKLRISGLALKEGTFNGVFFPAEEIRKAAKTLEGKPLRLEHNKEKSGIIGKVIKAYWDEASQELRYEAIVEKPEIIARVKCFDLIGNSVGVLVDYSMTNRGLTARNLEFTELSLTVNPACKDCRVREIEEIS